MPRITSAKLTCLIYEVVHVIGMRSVCSCNWPAQIAEAPVINQAQPWTKPFPPEWMSRSCSHIQQVAKQQLHHQHLSRHDSGISKRCCNETLDLFCGIFIGLKIIHDLQITTSYPERLIHPPRRAGQTHLLWASNEQKHVNASTLNGKRYLPEVGLGVQTKQGGPLQDSMFGVRDVKTPQEPKERSQTMLRAVAQDCRVLLYDLQAQAPAFKSWQRKLL